MQLLQAAAHTAVAAFELLRRISEFHGAQTSFLQTRLQLSRSKRAVLDPLFNLPQASSQLRDAGFQSRRPFDQLPSACSRFRKLRRILAQRLACFGQSVADRRQPVAALAESVFQRARLIGHQEAFWRCAHRPRRAANRLDAFNLGQLPAYLLDCRKPFGCIERLAGLDDHCRRQRLARSEAVRDEVERFDRTVLVANLIQ
ncbi:hypothetical protein D3C84_790410 [compost metagenome]